MADGRITIDTRIDTSGIGKGIDDIEDKLGKVKATPIDSLKDAFSNATKDAKVFGISLGDLGGMMKGGEMMAGALGGAVAALATAFIDMALKAAQAAIQALSDFAKQGIETASAIQESANVIDVVFGDDDVTQWAESMGKSFNLATDEAMKFASTFGAVMTPTGLGTDTIEEMSITLTQLSGDLSSLWNTSTEQAFNALRSGLTGEMEPLKQFGVVMSEANLNAYALAQGIDKTTKEMTESEKAVLRYNYILENTAIAQGDVARSSDSFANTQRALELAVKDLGAAFGGEMLPALSSVTSTITSIVSSFTGFVTLIGNLFGVIVNVLDIALKAVYQFFKPFIEALDLISRTINAVIDTFEILFDEVGAGIKSMTGKTKDSAEDMGYYMQDFAELTEESMEGAAKSVEEAFEDSATSIKDELGIIGDALKEYYKDDLREYKKNLEKKYGDSKAAQIKIATLAAERERANEQAYNRDMAMYEKKANSEIAAEQAKVDAYKRQQKTVNETYEKELNWIDKIKQAWSDAFKGSSINSGSTTSSMSGRSEFMAGRSALASSYANTYSNSVSTSNNTYNMNLYGSDFVSAMQQAQMMNRMRG